MIKDLDKDIIIFNISILGVISILSLYIKANAIEWQRQNSIIN